MSSGSGQLDSGQLGRGQLGGDGDGAAEGHTSSAGGVAGDARSARALTRYRVMAWVTGVMLLILVGVAMPLKYAGGNDTLVSTVGPVHGLLYIIYLVTVIDLASRRRWPLSRIAAAVLAGVVPFMAFVVEHRIVAAERAAHR